MNDALLESISCISREESEILSGRREIDRDIYMEKPNVVDAKKLLESGKLISVRTHTRFIHFPPHRHNYIEAVYMCSGQTTHIINGDEVALKAGELLFLSRGSVQEIMPAARNDVAVNFIILPEFFEKVLFMVGREDTPLCRFITDCVKRDGGQSGYLHFKVADVLPVQNLVENLIWTIVNDLPNKRSINQSTMALLMLQLMNNSEKIAYTDDSEKAVFCALQYIEENYRSGSLQDLARKNHRDFTWYSRELKRRTGKNYTELVRQKRLSQACYLLKNTKMSVADISNCVGYENTSYFHKIFYNEFKLTPHMYRKK